MESRSTLGIILTLVGVSGLTFAIVAFLNTFIASGAFAGITLLACLIFLGGITMLNDRLTDK